MSSEHSSTRPWMRRLGVRTLVLLGIGGIVWGVIEARRPPKPSLDGLSTMTARRVDLSATLRSAGLTESAEKTIVECKLERLEMRSEGRSSMVGGASTILWVIQDGSMVKKGDVLCTLDASDYEELVLQQEIKVERARADVNMAKLDMEAAELGVFEYRDGLMKQTREINSTNLAMAESDVEAARDRLSWSIKMKGKEYRSSAQVLSDEITVRKAEFEVQKAKRVIDNYARFGSEKWLRELEVKVEAARAEYLYEQLRCSRTDERLEYYKTMVANCTIRAPHDGLVVYAPPKLFSSDPPIEAGSRVRQMQDLFWLPDLSKMRVASMLHESVMGRVHPGMTVRARIEGMSGRQIEGHVLSIDPLPDLQNSWASDTRSFKATIQLDNSPQGIRPDMTADVEIHIDRRSQVVAIPTEALEVVEGKDYCYVAIDGQIERRPVKVGQSNREYLEVTDGVEEGEQVVCDLSHLNVYATLIVDAPPRHDSASAVAEAARHAAESKAGL
jgi:HlyD family secretion protein